MIETKTMSVFLHNGEILSFDDVRHEMSDGVLSFYYIDKSTGYKMFCDLNGDKFIGYSVSINS